MIIYGFRAMFACIKNKTIEDFERLEKSDYDIICTFEEFLKLNEKIKDEIEFAKPTFPSGYFIKTKKCNYDIHILRNDRTSNELLYKATKEVDIYSKTLQDDYGNEFKVVPLELLLLIKKSHLFIRKNFKKHMDDYLRLKNIIINKTLRLTLKAILYQCKRNKEFYELRLNETLKRAEKQTRHINLNQCKDNFFDTKGVTYLYDHDTIHESIKLREYPAYLDILTDGEDVLCSKEKWDKLSYSRKMDCVMEEAYTIAVERFLSKNAINRKTGKEYTCHEAFMIALEKICTTLCKGWFREFAYLNYYEALSIYNSDFYEKFKKALDNGLIKPFE